MTTQVAQQDAEQTTHLPCRRCGVAVAVPVWVLEVVNWPDLRGLPWCAGCRQARQHARRVAAVQQTGAGDGTAAGT